MSYINLPNQAGEVATFIRAEGPDTVHMQAVVPVDPISGEPLDLAKDATVAAINELTDTMVTLLSAMLRKMPRLASGERVAVCPVDATGAYEINSAYWGVNLFQVSETTYGRSYPLLLTPFQLSDAGCARLYQQISVS